MLGEVSSTSWTILSPQCSERKGFPEIQFDDWLEASAACAGRQSSLRGIPERRMSPDSGGASPHVPVASRRSCTESFYGSVVAEPVSDAPVTSLSRPSDRLLQRPRSPQSRAEAEQDSAHFTTEIVICGQDEGASDPKVSARSVPRTDDMNNNWASSPPSDQSLASIKRPPMAAISCDCGANLDLPMFPEMMEHNPTMSGGDSGRGKIRTF
ncbi:hypothetical protein BSKO_00732 [Bryopsis sp. KO-2023]|nr:hypothetical protein BSKO_00732 [Bryopsis sp. KO-2023]